MMGLGGCAAQQSNQIVLDRLTDMQTRLRLLQSELSGLRQAVDESDARNALQSGSASDLQNRLDDLQRRVAALPEQIAVLCPAGSVSAALTSQREGPDVQRVMVSGDKLVVGEVERVWVEPPQEFLEARIDPATDHSTLNARDVVEFERDGNKWVRFGIKAGKEVATVERPLKRTAKIRDDKHPVVTLRVQIGDVRETVEFILMHLSDEHYPLVLGRNFLTDVALVDVARKHVQPAFKAPSH